jgi:Tfp pilus assembly protein PilX
MRKLCSQAGYLLVTAAILIVIFGFLAASITYMAVTESHSATSQLVTSRALYVAESGLQAGIIKLLSPNLTQRAVCSGIPYNNQSVGDGKFTLAYTLQTPTSATTLRDYISETDKVIPVVDAAEYAPSGRLMIDREMIDYTGIGSGLSECGGHSSCFIGGKRGRDNTKAVNHDVGTPVGQYQCDIQSTGGIPDASQTSARRILSENVQLERGWLIGAPANISDPPNHYLAGIYRWNENQWPRENFGMELDRNLFSISMLSNVDGWILGSGIILHYDGLSWSEYTSSRVAGNLKGLYCVSANDCWIVGSSGLIYHYPKPNGSPKVWYRFALVRDSELSKRPILTSVYCVDNNNCWAVGYIPAKDVPYGFAKSVAYHYHDNVWTQEHVDGYPGDILEKVYCYDADNCWAVGKSDLGGRGIVYRYDSSVHEWYYAAFMYFNGSGWEFFKSLRDVYCTSGDSCWFVGGEGWFYYYNGVSLNTRFHQTDEGEILHAVSCYNSKNCWAAGNSGYVYHYDGLSWTKAGKVDNTTAINGISLVGASLQPEAIWKEEF